MCKKEKGPPHCWRSGTGKGGNGLAAKLSLCLVYHDHGVPSIKIASANNRGGGL